MKIYFILIIFILLIINPLGAAREISQKEHFPKENIFNYHSFGYLMKISDLNLHKGFLAYWHKFVLRKNYILNLKQNPENFSIENIKEKHVKEYFSNLKFKKNLTAEFKKDKLNILVFNSEYSRDTKGIKEILNHSEIDVAFLTEVDDSTKRSLKKDTIAEIAGNKFNFVYGPEFWEKDPEKGMGYTGNLILSRLKLKNFGFKFLDNCFPWNDWKYEPRIGARNFVYGEISLDGKKILLISTHLEDKCDSDSRVFQMQTILDRISYDKYDLIFIGGDLNTRTKKGEEKMDALMSKNGFEFKKVGRTWKYLNFLPKNLFPFELDKFYVKSNEKVDFNVEILKNGPDSDHYPLLIQIKFVN